MRYFASLFRAVLPAGRPVLAGASLRDPVLERRLAGVFVAGASLLVLAGLALPRLALERESVALVGGLGLVLAALLVADDRPLGAVASHLAGIAAAALLAVAALVDRPGWQAPTFLLALVVLWFALLRSAGSARAQAGAAAVTFAVPAYLHDGIPAAAAQTVLLAVSLAAGAALVGRLRGAVAGRLADDRRQFERRLVEGESRLRETEERYRTLIEALPLATYVTTLDGPGSTLYVSPQIEELVGCPVAEWTGDAWEAALYPDDRERVLAARRYHRETGQPFRAEYRIVRRDGRLVWVLDEAVVELDPRGRPRHSRGYLQEITERRRLEEQLAHRALHDPLTGLPNRALLLERLNHWTLRRHPQRLAVLYVDLDDFKVVNDRLGHAAGDEVLVEVARRLAAVLRPEDTIARIGGDEFAILVEGIEPVDAESLAERVIAGIGSSPVSVAGEDFVVEASVGIATSTGREPRSADLLLNHADMALYEAKGAGKGRAAAYAAAMGAGAATRQRMREELRRALDHEEFELHFQPIVDLATARIAGVEALVRWRHPTHGMVQPGTFIDVAVETGQIVPLGRWVLDEACGAAAALRGLASEPLWVTFNLALRELRERDLVEVVQAALARHAVRPSLLMLEITEAAFLPDERSTTARLHALRDLGLRLAIDDFGTGYSSLSYLTRVPADTVKLARPFTVALGSTGAEATLAQSVVRLCADLGFSTIGEGIETPRQRELLHELGCPLGQGFLFARPMPLHRLVRVLETDRGVLLPQAAVV